MTAFESTLLTTVDAQNEEKTKTMNQDDIHQSERKRNKRTPNDLLPLSLSPPTIVYNDNKKITMTKFSKCNEWK